MKAYAESSAILAWLLGEPRGEDVRRILEDAARVVASRLTRLECLRGIVRAETAGRASRAEAAQLLQVFSQASAEWTLIDVAPEVLDRAGASFPDEPVRALAAIHLATVLVVRSGLRDVEIIALDEQVRRNALHLGIPVQPA